MVSLLILRLISSPGVSGVVLAVPLERGDGWRWLLLMLLVLVHKVLFSVCFLHEALLGYD